MTHDDSRLRAMLAESGIAEDGSEQLLTSLSMLERYAEDPAPAPSPELAAMLDPVRREANPTPLRRRPGRLLVASAVALGTVAAGGVAAAANELPPGAQDLVADFGERYLHVKLPRSEERAESSTTAPATDEVAERAATPAGIPEQVPTFEDGTVTLVVDPDAWSNLGRLSAPPPPPPTASTPPPTAPTPSLTQSPPAATPSAAASSRQPSASPTSTSTPTSTPPPTPTGGTSEDGESVETGPHTPASSAPGGAATGPSPAADPDQPASKQPDHTGESGQSAPGPSPSGPSGAGTMARKDLAEGTQGTGGGGGGDGQGSGSPGGPKTDASPGGSGSTG